MSNHHFVELEGDAGSIAAHFVCTAPAGADCRVIPDCECFEWHEPACVERYPQGPPMKPVDSCNHKDFIDAEGAEWCASGGKVTVPVTTFWDENAYAFDFDALSTAPEGC